MNRPLLSCLLAAALFIGAPSLQAATEEKKPASGAAAIRDKSWLHKLDRWAHRIEKIDAKLSGKNLSDWRRNRLLRQREKSLAGLDSTQQSNNDNHAAQITMARAFLRIGEFPRARSAAERAAVLAPDDQEALSVRALARLKTGDAILAAEDAKKVLKMDPNNMGARDILRKTAPASATESVPPASAFFSTAPASPEKKEPAPPAAADPGAEK